ncbi:MAG: hypothetical protein RIM96_19710 [Thalassobaculum sp.]|uniref:hypothetical protein n=1 Tax=Thalassobaculum sp. TaxID=2022740 RepID=UPI0032ED8DB0
MAIPHRSGRRPQAPADRAGLEVLLRRAAKRLGYGPSDFDIRRPAADSASDRVLELHADDLLLAVMRPRRGRPTMLARRRASRTDHLGGQNHVFAITLLVDPARFVALLRERVLGRRSSADRARAA